MSYPTRGILFGALIVAMTLRGFAQDVGDQAASLALETVGQKAAYTYGYQAGLRFKRMGGDFEVESFILGFQEALTGGGVRAQ